MNFFEELRRRNVFRVGIKIGMITISAANSSRNRKGKVRTHCLTGASGNTWSTRCAADSTMRLAPASHGLGARSR